MQRFMVCEWSAVERHCQGLCVQGRLRHGTGAEFSCQVPSSLGVPIQDFLSVSYPVTEPYRPLVQCPASSGKHV